MGFLTRKEAIEENDLVILYVNFNTIYPVYVRETVMSKKGVEVENIYQTKYGSLKAMDLVGVKYGSKVQLSRGFAFALHPTPELWTKCLPHRTQILYSTDIAMITLQLELGPGSVVIESGTGSGSLSHSLMRTLAPDGHLHTFDFHAERTEKARQEFQEHGLGHLVTATHRDVCAEGFGLENTANGVFLDLPHPWEVISSAKKAMKKSGGRICSFSPCIEQVQKTCVEMKACGFTEITTMECLNREFQVRKIALPVFDSNLDLLAASRKRKLDNEGGDTEIKADPEEAKAEEMKDAKFVTGVPLTTMPGHTGFLTFATLPPKL